MAEFVGTRTPEECVVHFVRMPLEDPFWDPALLLQKVFYEPTFPSSFFFCGI